MTKFGRIGAAAAVVLVIAGGWYLFIHKTTKTAAAPPGVPVTAGKAAVQDVPVYVRGLGTVQPYNTVTIKPRVDGQITQVLFTEGQ
jgi:multidrug efflux system membrane fusion protein